MCMHAYLKHLRMNSLANFVLNGMSYIFTLTFLELQKYVCHREASIQL